MIRRIALAALLFASPVLAAPAEGVRGGFDRSTGRLLVTYEETQNKASTNAIIATQAKQLQRTLSAVRDILNAFGVQYTIVPPSAMKTEFARIGKVTWGFGTTGATVETFDGVLVVNDVGHLARKYSGMRIDSLSSSATASGTAAAHGRSLPAVPIMRLSSQFRGYGYASFRKALNDTLTDSTGVDPTSSISVRESWGTCQLLPMQYLNGTTKPYFATGFASGMSPNATAPAGGLRYHIRTTGNGASQAYFYEPRGANSAAWLDSAAYGVENGSGVDTVQVWERMNAHVTGAKPMLFVYPYGGSNCSADTVGSGEQWPCEFDATAFVMGISRMDSLMGGTLIKRPVQAAVVVTGAFSRVNSYRGAGGIYPPDTSAVWAALDSAATLRNVKWTIGGNPDSVSSYASEIAHWKSLGQVRWTPWNLRGVRDTTSACDCYGADPWGRYRDRLLAVGPYNLSGYTPQDSSLSSLLRYNRDLLARLVNGTPSGCAVAPFDDWTPKNTAPFKGYGSVRLTPDSVLYAVTRAGFSTLVYNAQRPFSPVTMIGFNVPRQGKYVGRLSSGSTFDINLLGHTGMAIRGSAFQVDLRTDSAMVDPLFECRNTGGGNTTAFVSIYNTSAYEHHRWWYGLLAGSYRDYDFMPPFWLDAWEDVNTPKDDTVYGLKRASIIRLSASDFGSGGLQNPTRPGYWSLKSLSNAFDAANALAGRQVCQFVWPEDVQP